MTFPESGIGSQYPIVPDLITYLRKELGCEEIERELEYRNIGRLDYDPTIELLKFLPSLEDEVGLFKLEDYWYFLMGYYMTFPIYDVLRGSEVIVHAHLQGRSFVNTLPSVADFLHTPSPESRHFVDSDYGLIRYWPIDPPEYQYRGMVRRGGKYIFPHKETEHLAYLKDNRCEWMLYA